MATVHRAIERGIEGFERVVALKRLLPHLAEDEEFVRAFVREAKLASLLRHLSIVQIYELGRVGSSYFISMEYIPGRDLRVILRHARRVCGPPPIEVALALMNELLDALDYAHGQRGPDGTPLGLVHRDISPSNLIVSHTGHLKIIDFGIAKATTGHLMTNTGRVKGKLSYMAPEALAGRLDSRSDLFSASVIAHELLTATPLFAAKEDLQTVERLQNMQPAPPSTRNPACPIGLDEIVLRGLAKDPAQRWQSAGEMRAAIGELANDRHRLASKREVVHWVEEAFEMQPPARLRLPLTAPGAPLDARRGAAASDADDELMDMVWGGTGPSAQIPVVLDEVPDVTGRIARAALTRSARRPATDPQDPLVEEEPTNDMLRPGEIEALSAAAGRPAGFRSTGPLAAQGSPGDLFSLGNGVQPHVSWAPGDRASSRPPEWAFGTASTTGQPPPSGVIDPSIAAAQRAMAPYPGTASTIGHDKRSGRLLPLLIASVAVAGAGAAIAWIVSTGGDEDDGKVASASPPAAQVPPPEVSKLVEGTAPEASTPPPAQGEASAAENKVIVADPDRADEPSDAAAAARSVKPDKGQKNEAKNEKEERAARDEEDRESRKRARAKRETPEERIKGRARARTSAEDEAEEADPADDATEEAEPEETGGRVAGGPPPARTPAPRSSAESTTATRATRSTESAAEETTTPAAPSTAAPPRARKPLVITPGRAKRESGTIPPLRFPPWEQAPAALAAKLCIDPTGAVTSVTVLSAVSPGVRASVKRALTRWRYRPVVDAGEKVAACFATTFQVKVE